MGWVEVVGEIKRLIVNFNNNKNNMGLAINIAPKPTKPSKIGYKCLTNSHLTPNFEGFLLDNMPNNGLEYCYIAK